MVQLQRDLKTIEAAGIQVVGISYDEPKVLKAFSGRQKITFPLLSDPGSRTIDAFHIRSKAAHGRAEGVPNPGTFLLDRRGTVRAKLFLEMIGERHSTAALVKAAKGFD